MVTSISECMRELLLFKVIVLWDFGPFNILTLAQTSLDEVLDVMLEINCDQHVFFVSFIMCLAVALVFLNSIHRERSPL